MLSHGRILTVGGYGGSGIGLVRYTRKGRLDSSYSGDRIATYRDPLNYSYGANLARAGSGRIAVAGSHENPSDFDILVTRFSVGGVLDPSFGRSFSGDGVKRIRLKHGGFGAAMARDRKGRLIVVGGIDQPSKPSLAAVWRLRRRGSLDRSFGKHGLVTLGGKARSDSAFGVLLQPNKRIVVIGEIYDNVGGANRLVTRLLNG